MRKKVYISFVTNETETAQDEPGTRLMEDPDDDIIRAPKARIRKKRRGTVEDDVGYVKQKSESVVPTKALQAKVGQRETVEDASFSGEEASRSISG
ncbi:hypothetical protein OESDEN_15435 [Oesophagostomum dentatum]|uniref:Uncharacterized protein n=1 Tax=Oesophagostomum dentatum TaxID=61180 RepID=A0A0B1SLS7_OESDE|nr:hypothetical protein OESDEN_15435 [Oesophagostomum dentatum]